MDEKEVKLEKWAWQVYSDALKIIELPSFVTINRKDDGTFSCDLLFSYQNEGSAFIYFKPGTLPIKNILKMSTFGNELLEPFRKHIVYNHAKSLAYLLFKNLFAEMEDVFTNLLNFPYLVAGLGLSEVDDKYKKKLTEKSKKDIEKFLQGRNKITKNRIMNEIYSAGKWNQPAFNLVSFYYDELLSQWKAAKEVYKANKNFRNWEKMLAASFEDLPTDLLQKLGDPDNYSSMPSTIALEHAARICGIKPNSVVLRTLQNYLEKSRKWINKEGAEKAIGIFVKHKVEAIKKEIINEIADEFLNEINSSIEKL